MDPLPHGAKRFELGKASFSFAKDKLIVSFQGERGHFTVQSGPHSKVLDIHYTRKEDDGSCSHTPLFEIRHENLLAMFHEMAQPNFALLRGLRRPVGPGWIAKHRLHAVVGFFPLESDIPAITTTASKRKLVVDPARYAQGVRHPEFLEELYDLRDGENFTLYSTKRRDRGRRVGFGFKFTDVMTRRPRLVWFRERDIGKMFARANAMLVEFAKRYGEFHKPLPWDFSGT